MTSLPKPSLAAELAARGYAVVPGFFAAELVAALRAEVQVLDADGGLRPAGVGKAEDFRVRTDVRSDRILWLDPEDCTGPQAEALEIFDELRKSLNRSCFLGLFATECHLAAYAPGGHYDKHLDAFRLRSQRKISFVLYLNDDWRKADGGELRLYRSGSDTEVACDIRPEAGTLVCFASEEIWHEVRPTNRTRLSLTGWFLGL